MSLETQEILRINCPGYGEQSNFSCARPFNEYRAIIINPASILHLFDRDPELLKQINQAQMEALSSFTAKSDKLLDSLNAELDARAAQMTAFLDQGGLLVYFLCRPFNISAPGITMDNYSWLGALAPDKPHEKNERHMASGCQGTNIETTYDGQSSPFIRYLKQAGLEWTTLIRSEFLSSGYKVLATAGPDKCVSAVLNTGNQGGTVVFLPAPYDKRFDDVLISCLEPWVELKASQNLYMFWQSHNLDWQAGKRAGRETLAAEHSTPDNAVTDKPEAAVEEPLEPSNGGSAQPEQAAPWSGPISEAVSAPGKAEVQAAGIVTNNRQDKHKQESTPREAPAGNAPAAKDLIEKMEEISKSPVPEWCRNFSFADLEKMQQELAQLKETIRLAQDKIESVEARIHSMDDMKNALLAADGEELYQACRKVFEQLGWQVKASPQDTSEFYLAEGESIVAIVRILRTVSKPRNIEVARLAESIISYWGEHEQEPKGILLASTYAERPPHERTQEDFSEPIDEFARKKNLCLMTALQLLSIYRDVEDSPHPAGQIKEELLSTTGRLPGFVLEARLAGAAK